MKRINNPNYKRQNRQNGMMYYRPRDIGEGMVVLADKTVYRTGNSVWRKVGTLSTVAGKVI